MPAESSQRPPTIDPVAAVRWARLPIVGEGSPWLHEEIGRRMEDRLQWITAKPASWADWSPLRGGLEAHARVARRYRDAPVFVIEPDAPLAALTARTLAVPWWNARRWQGGQARFEAPPEAGVDLLWANMALHMAPDPQALIATWHARLATDGFLMFWCLGPDTLHELRGLYEQFGWPPPGHQFTDMHDWGDMLVGAGFAEPIMDMERVVLTWGTPEAALAELRGLGRNLHPQRFGALRGRRWRDALHQALAALAVPGHNDGRIALTFEVVYGHAFKPPPRVALSGESAVSLRQMREMLQRGRP